MVEKSNEGSASNSGGGGMGSKRFKLIMRYKKLAKECETLEADLYKMASSLALTADCLAESKDKEEFYIKETPVLKRKAEKARLQIE